MLSRLRYTFREMWASLSRNLTLTVATVITSMISLLLFGLTLLLQRGFDNQLDQWSGGVEMIVYVSNDASTDQITLVPTQLQTSTLIHKVTYCPIACSVDNAKRLFGGDTATLSQLGPDKIPSFFKIVPKDTQNTAVLNQLSTSIKGLPKVVRVAFPGQQIDTLRSLRSFFGPRTLIMAVVLLGAAALLIWNTIRTAMFARRREIEVMKLVGATNWFIRVPYLLEGLVQGVIGAVLACIGVGALNTFWKTKVIESINLDQLQQLQVTGGQFRTICILLLVVGAA